MDCAWMSLRHKHCRSISCCHFQPVPTDTQLNPAYILCCSCLRETHSLPSSRDAIHPLVLPYLALLTMDNTAPWAAAASEAPPARARFSRVASVAFFATTAVFWLVLLGGIATLEGLCTGGATGNVGSCGNDLSKAWWILALELFCIIGAVMLASGSPLVSRFSHTLLAVWTIETTLLMVAAADFVIPAYYTTGDL
ncbi:hypothetical protein HaLaN_18811, partial [Haematococcus lacustris]